MLRADSFSQDGPTVDTHFQAEAADPSADGVNRILELVEVRTGVDLHPYRRPTLLRRVETRMRLTSCRDYEHYVQLLLSDPAEAGRLVEHVTIKVSRFFRNHAVFALLGDEVLPSLARTAHPRELRLWSAGCGNGEEAYSLAILIRESATNGTGHMATIYGSDVDLSALRAAREGLYPVEALSETPAPIAEHYFTPRPGRVRQLCQIRDDAKAQVRFLQHDLLSGTPVLDGMPFHLVLCRNVLIYFDRAAQASTFDLLTDSLSAGGYLCLGEAEQLPSSHDRYYTTIDRRYRLYRRR